MAVRIALAILAALSALPSAVEADAAGIFFERAEGRLDPPRATLSVSRHVTHDASLPRGSDEASDDPGNFRLVAVHEGAQGDVLYAWLEALRPDGRRRGLLRHIPLLREGQSARFRSSWLRLVADDTDLSAPDIRDRLLRVALRDRVRAGLGSGVTVPTAQISVTARAHDGTPEPVLTGRIAITVLRLAPNAAPVIGDSDEMAIALAREQIEVANEVWAQCGIEFGDPNQTEVKLVELPPAALLAFGDTDGLWARGDGQLEVIAGKSRVGPVRTRAGDSPIQSAERMAAALRKAGFSVTVSENPRCDKGAAGSADLVVRDKRGALVGLSLSGSMRTDSQQSMRIGEVDLRDGLEEFDNIVAAAGTLEERTLIKLLGDNDPTTIDLFIVNSFVAPSRQGEAFIEADRSPLANTVIIDRNAVRFERQAWVAAHELGHVLLDEALHPDNIGRDRPWLLMDADARQGRVNGPKRLTDEECSKARRRSGPEAGVVLLTKTQLPAPPASSSRP